MSQKLVRPAPLAEAPVEARVALRKLAEGNARFANELTSMSARLTATREWRAHLADRQTPFATIMSCSDSRVPAEIIFDQGLGDLFIVRNAGTPIGAAPLASVEFAVAKLCTRLVLVLAHERCGAFRAAYEADRSGEAPASESLRELVARLHPSIVEAGPEGTEDERCERAARISAARVAGIVAASPLIAPLVREGAVLVVPAYYRLTEGTVEFSAPVPCGEARPA